MSFIVKIVKSVVSAVVSVVKAVWDNVAVPLLEWVFALIGIVDETVVTAQRISVPVFGNYSGDQVQDAIIRAVTRKIKTDTDFFPSYMQEMYETKSAVNSYYRYGESGQYIHGLPTLSISGVTLPEASVTIIVNAIEGIEGVPITVLRTHSGYLDALKHFQKLLIVSHQYVTYSNRLTKDDLYGVSRSDWTMNPVVVYNVDTSDYTINIYRHAKLARFWIEGPGSVTESDTAVFTVKSNREVPAGKSAVVNLAYTGTAVNGVNYTEVQSVVMAELTSEVQVEIVTADLPSGELSTVFTISLDSVPNTGGVFEHVLISSPSEVTCTIASDDALVLSTRDIAVEESGTATVPIKLEQATVGPFTVDYGFTDVTATGGIDYDNTGGTLSFTGTAGEVQNVLVPITADLVSDDKEQFKVTLSNCSDPLVDIDRVSTVTIQDSSSDYPQTLYTIGDTIHGDNFTPERHLIVEYHLTGTSELEWFYWFYNHADGTYDIEPSSEALEDLEMLPVVVLMKDGVFCDVDKEAELYTTTKKLMDKLSLDIDDFITNIGSSPGDGSSNLTDAYVNFAMIPAETDNVMSKLLYRSFFQVIVTDGLYSDIGEYSASFREGDINNAVVWTNQTYAPDITGVATAEGDYIHSVQKTSTGSILSIKHQKTASTYDMLEVHNLNSLSAIDYNGYHQVATSSLWNKDTNSIDKNFSMALSWYVFASLTAKEQTAVYRTICRLDMYSLQVVHLEWYETEAFMDLFNIVMIAITIFTLGQAYVATQSFYAVLKVLAKQYLIGELVVFVAEATGSELLAAVAGIVATVMAHGDGTDSLSDIFDVIDAMKLSEQATLFSDNITEASKALQRKDMQDLIDDGMEIEEAREKFEAEEKAREEARFKSPITVDFLNSLKSLEYQIITAIDSQYQFDATLGYGMVDNYHKTNLRTGII